VPDVRLIRFRDIADFSEIPLPFAGFFGQDMACICPLTLDLSCCRKTESFGRTSIGFNF
jgi:hypothetical protein